MSIIPTASPILIRMRQRCLSKQLNVVNIFFCSFQSICGDAAALENTVTCVCLAEPTLRYNRGGDVPAGPDVVRGLAWRLPGHSGQERAGGGADETT